MASFIAKKKKFKFQVTFTVEELDSVPIISGVLFVKVRLLDGGNFTEYSTREQVFDHLVRWRSRSEFTCKMVGSATSGVLESCVCRVSVRKELKGGKAWQKLGYADINLAEYAGAGSTNRGYLLEGYDSKKRLDNSVLKVNINMSLLSGDPCFKAPRSRNSRVPSEAEQYLQPENKGAGDDLSSDSVASGSSGFGSLPRKPDSNKVSTDPQGDSDCPPSGASTLTPGSALEGSPVGHCRNASCVSNQSKVSGYCSNAATHSRQSSLDSNKVHRRTSSVDSSDQSRYGSTGRPKKLEPSSCIERRVDSTRVDVNTIVDEVLQGTDLLVDESTESSCLQLYVAKDGSTALGAQQVRSHGVTGKFQAVVIDDR